MSDSLIPEGDNVRLEMHGSIDTKTIDTDWENEPPNPKKRSWMCSACGAAEVRIATCRFWMSCTGIDAQRSPERATAEGARDAL